MDDVDIVRAAQQGSRAAITAMYDTYGSRVHDAAVAMLRDRDAALDTTYDVFVSAGERIHGLEEPHRLGPWLLAITRYHAARRAGALAGADRTPLAAMVGDPEQAELTDIVWDASASLPLRDRAMLDLSLRQGLDGEDLADAMGVTLTQAYDLQSRMRDRTEKALSAFLVARTHPERFGELEKLTRQWSEKGFSRKLERQTASLVENDRAVNQTRFTLPSPFALYAAAPLAAVPPFARDRVLEQVAVPVPAPDGTVPLPADAEPWLPNGFPPPSFVVETERVSRRGPIIGVAAALLAVLAVVAALLVLAARDDDSQVATGSTTTLASVVDPNSTTTIFGATTTIPGTDTTAAPGAPTTAVPGATTAPGPTAPTTAPPPTAAPGRMTLSTTTLDYGETSSEQTLRISNTGGSPLDFSIAVPPSVTPNPPSGRVDPGRSVDVRVGINRAALAEGDRQMTMNVSGGGTTTPVRLNARVKKAAPAISNVRVLLTPDCASGKNAGNSEWVAVANVTDETLTQVTMTVGDDPTPITMTRQGSSSEFRSPPQPPVTEATTFMVTARDSVDQVTTKSHTFDQNATCTTPPATP